MAAEDSSSSSSSAASVIPIDVGSNTAEPAAIARRTVRRIERAVGRGALAASDHRKVADDLHWLHRHLTGGGALKEEAIVQLTCAGILAQRLSMSCADAVGAQDIHVTETLLFVLVVTAQPPPPQQEKDTRSDSDVDKDSLQNFQTWMDSSLGDEILLAHTNAAPNSWAYQLRTPGARCAAFVREVQHSGCRMQLTRIGQIAKVFFQQACETMALRLFDAAGARGTVTGFVTLDVGAFLAQASDAGRGVEAERAAHIVDCAESEHGQQIFRDLILSFRLPRGIVGTRRTCLLSREANAEATRRFPEVLGAAHSAAMHGARWTWDEDDDPVHKMCALLAGIAVNACDDVDGMRRADAFSGRVDLPFLKTQAPQPGTVRLALLAHSNEWVVYSTDTSGAIRVRLRATGHEGMRAACLLFHQRREPS